MIKKHGVDGIDRSDAEILRLCLKTLYGRDCDELAESLALRFGSVSGIFAAPYEELISVPHVTARVASFFSSVMPINRQALLRSAMRFPLCCEKAFAEFFALYFIGVPHGADVCICLDRKNSVIGMHDLVSENRVREIARHICEDDAACIAVARRVSGLYDKFPVPTSKRRRFVHRVAALADIFSTEFVDYMEIDGGVFFSLRGMLNGKTSVRHISDADESEYPGKSGILEKLDARCGDETHDR